MTDVAPDVASTVGTELGCAVAADAAALAGRTDVEAVIVATPNHAHLAPTLAAVAAGKHVFVEKPMALRAADCSQMLSAADAAGVRLVVGHIMRLFPAVAETRRMIEGGEIGRPLVARALRTRWSGGEGLPPEWWKVNRALSGGELYHEIHELDLLCWLLGEPDSVFARAANLAHAELPAYDDVVQVSLRHARGALAVLEMGTAYQCPAWQCMVSGTAGGLVLDLRAATLTVYADGGAVRSRGVFDDERANESLRTGARVVGRAYNTPQSAPPYWMEHAVELEVRDLIEHFRSGRPSPLAEARERAVVAADAARNSIERGLSVRPDHPSNGAARS